MTIHRYPYTIEDDGHRAIFLSFMNRVLAPGGKYKVCLVVVDLNTDGSLDHGLSHEEIVQHRDDFLSSD